MPNTIELRKQYTSMLDEVYKLASLTAILDGRNDLAKEGANAGELKIPKMEMQGLANYSKSTGYVAGDITLEWETKTCTYDRGRMFTVDAEDNIETAGLAFGKIAGEFERTKVVPELDAYRLSTYAKKAGGKVSADLNTAEAIVTALRACRKAIKEAEARVEDCYLFVSSELNGTLEDMDTTKSRAVLKGWKGIIEVPTSRFHETITLTPAEAGGYTYAGSKEINFLAVDPAAVIQFQKHVVPKIITPEANQDADAWKFGYRNLGIAEVEDNKVAGIYCHTTTATV